METIAGLYDDLIAGLSSVPGLRYWAALLVFAVTWLGARVVDRAITWFFARLVRRTATQLDDIVIEGLHRPLTRTTILVGAYAAVALVQLPTRLEAWGFQVIETLLLVVWVAALLPLAGAVVTWMSAHPTRFSAVQTASQPLFHILGNVVLVGLGAYLALALWDIDVAGWAASVGIVGIAVGFAARDTLANLFAGVSILADAPYRIGDYIVLADGSNMRGEVRHIGLRSTRIVTRDDIEITIPNATIANSTVINESGGPDVRQRVRLRVGVAYDSEVDRVRETLNGVARAEPLVCADPEPRVRFREFADSALIFELLCWIEKAELRGKAIDALHTRAHRAFAEAGISIPFPQRVVSVVAPPEEADPEGSPRLSSRSG